MIQYLDACQIDGTWRVLYVLVTLRGIIKKEVIFA